MKKFALTGLAALLGASPAFAQDSTLAELRAQLNQLQARIDQLERERRAPVAAPTAAPAAAPVPANVVTGGDTPGSFKLPGSNTSVQIGGYVKVDAIYDRDQDLGDSLFDNGPSTTAGSRNGNFRLHARESRLRVKTSTPSALGELRTHVEGDFFSTGARGNELYTNSHSFRIRHAYGELGGFLAGQTWSNFMQFSAFPDTVDFDGPVGVTSVRQAQLRYTFPVGVGSVSIAAENPEGTGFADKKDSVPDFTARYAWSGAKAALEAATVVRRLAYDSATGDDAALGYGLMLAGSIALGDATRVMGSAIWGEGVGRYLFVAHGNAADGSGIGEAYIDGAGKLKTIKAYGFNLAASQQWTKQFSTWLSYGQVRGDRPGDLFPTSTEKLETIHLSNFYQLSDPVTLGFEISRAAIKLQNGDDADALRFQASAKYSF